jgi:hypothetical protein
VQGGVVGASRTRRRRWRRWSRLARDVSLGAPTDYDDNATAAACCLFASEPDPLALELCECSPPAWVDPMVEELTASLGVSPPGAPETRCLTAPAATYQEADAVGASLVGSSPSSHVQGPPQVTPL